MFNVLSVIGGQLEGSSGNDEAFYHLAGWVPMTQVFVANVIIVVSTFLCHLASHHLVLKTSWPFRFQDIYKLYMWQIYEYKYK